MPLFPILILAFSFIPRASGHVERFTDLMVKDVVTSDFLRADHLLKGANFLPILFDFLFYFFHFFEKSIPSLVPEHLNKLGAQKGVSAELQAEYESVVKKIDDFDEAELGQIMKKYAVKSPLGNDITDPRPFNLMFGTQIGPTGQMQGYLRPETAQGMFVNFKYLLEYNNGKMVAFFPFLFLVSFLFSLCSLDVFCSFLVALCCRSDWSLFP